MAYTYAGQFGPEAVLATVGGATVTVPNATVTVYEIDGVTLSTLYTNRAKASTTANPTTTDSAGNLTLFTTPGQHVVKISGDGVTKTVTLEVSPDPTEVVGRNAGYETTDTTQLATFAPYSSQVTATGGINALIGQVINDRPASTTAFPAGITGYGRTNNAGNQAFGLFGRADLYAAGVATNEFNAFNYASAPAGTYPPSRAIGTADRLPIVLTVASGGSYPSAIGIHVVKEGSSPQQMLTGIYVEPTAIRDYPMFIDGGTAAFPSVIAGSGAVRTAANVAAAFGVHLTDDASGALLLVGALTGTVPFIEASLSQGVGTDLLFRTNATNRARITAAGNFNLVSGAYQQAGVQVVSARQTGYTAMTGSPNRSATYDVATVTLAQLAARVAALQADLTTHGLVGA